MFRLQSIQFQNQWKHLNATLYILEKYFEKFAKNREIKSRKMKNNKKRILGKVFFFCSLFMAQNYGK